ncbi:hypothetical protein NQ317_006162 [Molorchus minor]|uniref:Uncharacterized protein n=1 Tax=Molorchus minor TaxID=1323400 RepID=A0ABQ9J8S7_9CUCU|nr:hypothetical protein NQ317_006162 [Molorchus minor]
MATKYLIAASVFLSPTFGANILGVVPLPYYSHNIAFAELWRELSLRGHNVTVITSYPARDPTVTNLTEIDVSFTKKHLKYTKERGGVKTTMWNVYKNMNRLIEHLNEDVLTYPPVQELIHNNEHHFDVVLVEYLFPEYLAFGKIYNCPNIVISSMEMCHSFQRVMGNPIHPATNPHLLTPMVPPLSFQERFSSTIYMWYLWYYHTYDYFPSRERFLLEYFNSSDSLWELLRSVDLMMVTSNPALRGGRAFGPATIEIGGQRKVIAKPLSVVSFSILFVISGVQFELGTIQLY